MAKNYHQEMIDLYKKAMGEKKDYSGLVCPVTYGKPCRLCELCKEVLFDKKNYPQDHPVRKRASSLNAKLHYFSNALFMANPSEIVIIEYGQKIFKQLLKLQMDETQPWQNFFQPVEGRWLVIDRIKGTSADQVDYVVKPRDVTKISNMAILTKLEEEKYNLSNIVANIKDNLVKPVYQSKFDQSVTIRILPSWLGPEYAFKFFEKVDYHFNLSEEDFEACLAGDLNPIRSFPSESASLAMEAQIANPPPKKSSSWGDYAPKPMGPDLKGGVEAIKTKEEHKESPKQEEEGIGFDDEEFPPCYGDYDSKELSCSPKKCSDWMEGCKKYTNEKLEKRKTAKRLVKS